MNALPDLAEPVDVGSVVLDRSHELATTEPAPQAVAASDHRPLRIAMLAPPWITVPRTGYGGVEAVITDLTEALVKFGHDVTRLE